MTLLKFNQEILKMHPRPTKIFYRRYFKVKPILLMGAFLSNFKLILLQTGVKSEFETALLPDHVNLSGIFEPRMDKSHS